MDFFIGSISFYNESGNKRKELNQKSHGSAVALKIK